MDRFISKHPELLDLEIAGGAPPPVAYNAIPMVKYYVDAGLYPDRVYKLKNSLVIDYGLSVETANSIIARIIDADNTTTVFTNTTSAGVVVNFTERDLLYNSLRFALDNRSLSEYYTGIVSKSKESLVKFVWDLPVYPFEYPSLVGVLSPVWDQARIKLELNGAPGAMPEDISDFLLDIEAITRRDPVVLPLNVQFKLKKNPYFSESDTNGDTTNADLKRKLTEWKPASDFKTYKQRILGKNAEKRVTVDNTALSGIPEVTPYMLLRRQRRIQRVLLSTLKRWRVTELNALRKQLWEAGYSRPVQADLSIDLNWIREMAVSKYDYNVLTPIYNERVEFISDSNFYAFPVSVEELKTYYFDYLNIAWEQEVAKNPVNHQDFNVSQVEILKNFIARFIIPDSGNWLAEWLIVRSFFMNIASYMLNDRPERFKKKISEYLEGDNAFNARAAQFILKEGQFLANIADGLNGTARKTITRKDSEILEKFELLLGLESHVSAYKAWNRDVTTGITPSKNKLKVLFQNALYHVIAYNNDGLKKLGAADVRILTDDISSFFGDILPKWLAYHPIRSSEFVTDDNVRDIVSSNTAEFDSKISKFKKLDATNLTIAYMITQKKNIIRNIGRQLVGYFPQEMSYRISDANLYQEVNKKKNELREWFANYISSDGSEIHPFPAQNPNYMYDPDAMEDFDLAMKMKDLGLENSSTGLDLYDTDATAPNYSKKIDNPFIKTTYSQQVLMLDNAWRHKNEAGIPVELLVSATTPLGSGIFYDHTHVDISYEYKVNFEYYIDPGSTIKKDIASGTAQNSQFDLKFIIPPLENTITQLDGYLTVSVDQKHGAVKVASSESGGLKVVTYSQCVRCGKKFSAWDSPPRTIPHKRINYDVPISSDKDFVRNETTENVCTWQTSIKKSVAEITSSSTKELDLEYDSDVFSLLVFALSFHKEKTPDYNDPNSPYYYRSMWYNMRYLDKSGLTQCIDDASTPWKEMLYYGKSNTMKDEEEVEGEIFKSKKRLLLELAMLDEYNKYTKNPPVPGKEYKTYRKMDYTNFDMARIEKFYNDQYSTISEAAETILRNVPFLVVLNFLLATTSSGTDLFKTEPVPWEPNVYQEIGKGKIFQEFIDHSIFDLNGKYLQFLRGLNLEKSYRDEDNDKYDSKQVFPLAKFIRATYYQLLEMRLEVPTDLQIFQAMNQLKENIMEGEDSDLKGLYKSKEALDMIFVSLSGYNFAKASRRAIQFHSLDFNSTFVGYHSATTTLPCVLELANENGQVWNALPKTSVELKKKVTATGLVLLFPDLRMEHGEPESQKEIGNLIRTLVLVIQKLQKKLKDPAQTSNGTLELLKELCSKIRNVNNMIVF